jgi:OHS family lactose permease-like MFS transporter
MVGVSFGHSLGLAILSPMVGKSYDLIGFPSTYLVLAGLALIFLMLSALALEPTPAETPSRSTGKPGAEKPESLQKIQ